VDEAERRAKHTAYMREYRSDPARRAAHNAEQLRHYRENRERILGLRRERSGAGPRRRRWTDQEILDTIRGLAVDGVASCPAGTIAGVAASRFGSWAAACKAAGVVSAWRQPLRPTAKYSTIHSRLNTERGMPDNCEQCGASGPGRRYEWALNLIVSNVLLNEKNRPYSIDLDDYRRLCKSCHVRQDRQRPQLPHTLK
jgi:hypothetical protein